MCLAIPAQISRLPGADDPLALAEIMGVRRRVNIDLLDAEPPVLGDWVLIHVGFALSKISAEQADDQLKMLSLLGEASAAQEEVNGYDFGDDR
jgi:hydrogenase expression/formation protein HypC